MINVEGHPAYARAIAELKSSGELGRRSRWPTLSLFEQHRRAGPSFYQEAHRGEPLVPLGGGRTTDGCWLRGNARDTKGTNPMASQGGCCRSGPIHPADPRHCRLITVSSANPRHLHAVCDRSVYEVLRTGQPYRDRQAPALSGQQKDRLIRHHVRRLGKLGVRVYSLSAGAGSQKALSAN